MPTIVEDIEKASLWIAKALNASGYRADFSPASLWEVDRFFEEHCHDGKAKPGGLLSENLGSRIFSLGAYLGEVIRHDRGGNWVGDDNDPRVEINVSLHLPDDTICWPVQRVMKRYKKGPLEGIAGYGMSLGLSVGPRPSASP